MYLNTQEVQIVTYYWKKTQSSEWDLKVVCFGRLHDTYTGIIQTAYATYQSYVHPRPAHKKISEPQNQEIGEYYVVQERRVTDFEASKL